MSETVFYINEKDLKATQEACESIKESSAKDRVAKNIIAAAIASKFFEDYSTDTSSSICNLPCVIEDIDISDIYVNGIYIDIRPYFNENERCIPKAHFTKGVLPLAYMFIKLNEDLTEGVVTGFALPQSINSWQDTSAEYIDITDEDMSSFNDIAMYIGEQDNVDCYDTFDADVYNFIDGFLYNTDEFYKTLVASKEARLKLIKAAKAETVFENVEITSITNNEEIETKSEDEMLSEPDPVLLAQNDNEIFELDETDSDVSLLDESLTNDDIGIDIEDTNLNLSIEDDNFDINPELSEDIGDLEDTVNTVEDSEALNDLNIPDEIDNNELNFESVEVSEDYTESSTDNLNIDDEISQEEPEDEQDQLEIAMTEDVPNDNEMENVISLDVPEYSTETSPSLNDIENMYKEENEDLDNASSYEILYDDEPEENNELVTADAMYDDFNKNKDENVMLESNEIQDNTNNVETYESTNSNEQIEHLFNKNGDTAIDYNYTQQDNYTQPKRKSSIVPALGVALLICAAAGYGYNKYMNNMPSQNVQTINEVAVEQIDETAPKKEDAMPIETVENANIEIAQKTELPTNIPAVERNIDSSILISNLSVNWEVPTDYVSNAAAKRYFTKLGKILQLNLKTELLLVNKMPVTNKISVELEFNKRTQSFAVKEFLAQSGDATIDKVIKETITKSLNTKFNTDMSIFEKIAGNPVIVIHL